MIKALTIKIEKICVKVDIQKVISACTVVYRGGIIRFSRLNFTGARRPRYIFAKLGFGF